MKTMEQSRTSVSYKAADIKQETIKGLTKITTFIKENNYRLLIDDKETNFESFDLINDITKDLEPALIISSKRTKKKLLNRINGLEKGITLKKINTFLHFLKTKVLKEYSLPTHRIVVSVKETEIKLARVNWVTLRNQAEEALKTYKLTKADFYKKEKL